MNLTNDDKDTPWEFIIDHIEKYIEWDDFKFVSFFVRKKEWKITIRNLMCYKSESIDNACEAQ
jgi:hypothetical protein